MGMGGAVFNPGARERNLISGSGGRSSALFIEGETANWGCPNPQRLLALILRLLCLKTILYKAFVLF